MIFGGGGGGGFLGQVGGGISGGFKKAVKAGEGAVGQVAEQLGAGTYDVQGQDINKEAFKQTGQQQNRMRDFADALRYERGRLGAAIDQGASNEIRQRQMTLADQLAAQAAGQGPSLAQAQLNQATTRNLAQMAALAASARGGASGGLGMRGLQAQQASVASQAARDAALARIQEQMQARQQLSGVLDQTRGVDAQLAQQQASIEQNQRALNDAQSRFYQGALMDADNRQAEAMMDYEKLKSAQHAALESARSGAYSSGAQRRGDLIGGIGAGVAAAFSDKRLKKNIKDGGKDAMSMMEKYYSGGAVGLPPIDATPAAEPAKDDDEKDKKSSFEKFYEGYQKHSSASQSGHEKAGKAIGQGLGSLTKMLAASKGMLVPGKAEVEGDSPKNDRVPVLTSPGEVIMPRTVAASDDPKKVMEFLDKVKAQKYQYKNVNHGSGTYLSPMAQDLEKSEIGKSMVMDTPEGKMVDYARGAGAYIAMAANLHKRLKELEAKKNG